MCCSVVVAEMVTEQVQNDELHGGIYHSFRFPDTQIPSSMQITQILTLDKHWFEIRVLCPISKVKVVGGFQVLCSLMFAIELQRLRHQRRAMERPLNADAAQEGGGEQAKIQQQRKRLRKAARPQAGAKRNTAGQGK
jgi:hypothetical protein